MKKLMFAVAAVAAGTVLADVSSGNIVGFQNKEGMEVGMMSQLAPTFLQVGGEGENAKVTLTDLKVSGYEDPYVLDGLKITEINGNGIPATDDATGLLCNYVWQDFPEAGVPAGWYDDEGGILVSAERLAQLKAEGYEDLVQSAFGDAVGIKFAGGCAFYVTPADDGNPYTLTIPSPMGK